MMNSISANALGATTRFALRLLYALSLKGTKHFDRSLQNVETAQKKKLFTLLNVFEHSETGRKYGLKTGMTYDDFSAKIPVTTYKDWEASVLEQKESRSAILSSERCERYQPTSGSSSKMKWIPYTPAFLSELDQAISPLLVDAFRSNPGIFKGKHYWSLSWIPSHLRTTITPDANDDLKLLPWWKRMFMNLTMAVPTEVSYAATSEGSMISSLAHLIACTDISLISVWSPTFAINMFEQMAKHKDELISILKLGNWGDRSRELFHIPCPHSQRGADILSAWDGEISPEFLKRIWPGLALVSSWDTSSSRIWADELKKLFPDAGFLAKGLWATEGVVTIPYKGQYPLTVNSHFYEFLDPDTGKIYPAWSLKKDQIVKPLLTTGSGFIRYDLNDRLRVSGFLDSCPCFEFLGRMEGIDMIGEKLTPDIASEVIKKTGERFGVKALTLVATPGLSSKDEKPRYNLLCEAGRNAGLQAEIARYAAALLDESFHYKLASEIGQLGDLQVIFHPDCRKIYQRRNESRGMILGDMKIEPLVLWSENDMEFMQILTSDSKSNSGTMKGV
ncbi:MAG: GH3 auxin-responsive promoter family protein [Desulfobacteraceae bacterium]|jgi:hypothetical protein